MEWTGMKTQFTHRDHEKKFMVFSEIHKPPFNFQWGVTYVNDSKIFIFLSGPFYSIVKHLALKSIGST